MSVPALQRLVRRRLRGTFGIWPLYELRNKLRYGPAALLHLRAERREVARLRGVVGDREALVVTVMATFKRPDLLQAAVASALRQDVEGHVVVVVDDGGGDLPALPAAPNLIVVTLSRNTHHLGLVRNVGLALVRSRYVAVLDDDNTWSDDHLAVSLAALEDPGIDVVYTAVERRLPDGTVMDVLSTPFDRRRLREEAFVDANSIVARRSPGVRFSRIRRGSGRLPPEDWELIWRLSRRHHVLHVPAVTVRYLVNPNSYYSIWSDHAAPVTDED